MPPESGPAPTPIDPDPRVLESPVLEDAPAAGRPPAVLIVRAPVGRRNSRLVPPLILLALSAVLIAYRVGVTDWHWSFQHGTPRTAMRPAPPAGPTLALAEPAEVGAAEPEPRAVATPAAPEAGPVEAVVPFEPPTPSPPEDSEVPSSEAPDAPVPPAVAEDEEESIRREAEEARARRESLEKFKQEEAERLARAPADRRGLRRMDPAELEWRQDQARRQMDEMNRQIDQLMQGHLRQFERMARAWRGGMAPWPGLSPFAPPPPAAGVRPRRDRAGEVDAARRLEEEFDKLFDTLLRSRNRGAVPPPPPRPEPPARRAPTPPATPAPSNRTLT